MKNSIKNNFIDDVKIFHAVLIMSILPITQIFISHFQINSMPKNKK